MLLEQSDNNTFYWQYILVWATEANTRSFMFQLIYVILNINFSLRILKRKKCQLDKHVVHAIQCKWHDDLKCALFILFKIYSGASNETLSQSNNYFGEGRIGSNLSFLLFLLINKTYMK